VTGAATAAFGRGWRFAPPILVVILGYTWVLAPRTPRWTSSLVALVVLALCAWRAVLTREWGLRPSALWPALVASAAFTGAAVLVLYIAGSSLGGVHPRGHGWRDLAFLVPWALAQQFALQTVLLREAQAALSRSPGIAVATAGFGVLHLPNPFLTLVTVVAGAAWCWIYDRYPNLLPLALSHALCTLAILCWFDRSITGGLRVGYAYLQLR
jgi:membrane protease YdiL (CAAX protease family)